eukprot:scaffold1724_cov341-Pavlova_lutheri.AAC.23
MEGVEGSAPLLQDSLFSNLCPGNVHVASLSANKECMPITATGSQPALCLGHPHKVLWKAHSPGWRLAG